MDQDLNRKYSDTENDPIDDFNSLMFKNEGSDYII